jgi:dCTP diphosphatase
MSDINDLIQKIKQFRDDRDWMQFHDPKNMAISIVIEAAELLENFQWKSKEEVEEYAKQHEDDIEEEIADIAIYLFELADNLGIDLADTMNRKLQKNALKYPAEKARGKHTKYDKL